MFDSSWYDLLNKPFLMLPSWIFTPVWFILYILIFVSLLCFIFKKTEKSKLTGYIYFVIQMVLNFCWTPIFFGLKQMQLGLLIIVFMDIFVYLALKEFKNISKISFYLLIPYFVWIVFATYLTMGINILN